MEEEEEQKEEEQEQEQEEKDIGHILSQIDIKKLSCQDMKKLISQLVIHSDVKNPRSIWGVDEHKPCWWPKSQKFDTPWKIKDNQCVYRKHDAQEILSSALEWHKSNFKKTELK
ncbi:hypothetical protein EB796_012780 [Bugula neritina]|uniref:Uncharacterized protein n=1 Tax=Bugula neritina TaxID=10212 RepID=A0A7J7JU45_BUGNE|nr:hypothetical protein EB796_012780 [Bugula neritina]